MSERSGIGETRSQSRDILPSKFDRVFDRVSWGLGLSTFLSDQKGGTFYLDYIYACATAGWRRTTKPYITYYVRDYMHIDSKVSVFEYGS